MTHDVPVTVVPERLWADYQEPNMPDIDVSISAVSMDMIIHIQHILDKKSHQANFSV